MVTCARGTWIQQRLHRSLCPIGTHGPFIATPERKDEIVSHYSDQFLIKTGHRYLTNINILDNITSVFKHGLLSYESAKEVEHVSVALESVQATRNMKKVPNGLYLHQYASLYFSPRNPMMYYLKCHPEKADLNRLCVLLISPDVLSIPGTVMSDGNAAGNITRFYTPDEGLETVDFEKIYASWWTDSNPIVQEEKSRIKCAEVLVPYRIPFDMITGAVILSEQTRTELEAMGFTKQVFVHPNTFFM